LVRELGRTHLPVMIHPEFWNRRRVRFPGIEPAELPSTSRAALHEMGFSIVEEREPSFLLDGAMLITGEVDRTTAFETGFHGHEALRDGGWQADPLILDERHSFLVRWGRGHPCIRPRRRRAEHAANRRACRTALGGDPTRARRRFPSPHGSGAVTLSPCTRTSPSSRHVARI
jgi:hypothetical protein